MMAKQQIDAHEVLNQYSATGYVYKEYTYPIKALYVTTAVCGSVFGMLIAWLGHIDGRQIFLISKEDPSLIRDLLFLAMLLIIILICAPLQALLYGIGILPGCKWKWSGNIRIGFSPKMLAFYCNGLVPLGRKLCIVAGFLPPILLGGGLLVLSLIVHSELLFVISICNILGAVGSFNFVYILLRDRPDLVLDFPPEKGMGFFLLYKG